MRRPVWLFSLDTEQFCAPPMTTGGLLAYFRRRGRSAPETDVGLVHFTQREQIAPWLADWDARHLPRARQAVSEGVQPVLGFSCYTWNLAEFLDIIAHVRRTLPEALVVAGGPHVQRAEDFLHGDGIDVIVIGEGEQSFCELLDCPDRAAWYDVPGLAFLDAGGRLHKTAPRARQMDLGALPSALEVLELRDEEGRPKYQRVAYETTRGCPFRCAFCEWGTGMLGTKMLQHPLERIRDDFEALIAGGIQDIWLCDSNFGALPEDLDKAKLVVDLKQRTGQPSTFATSWSKTHNRRVQEIVELLHRHGLLQHYNLALQTLTPEALELSHRKNMRSNRYEPIAKAMAEKDVPIATELIWGLPGDNLRAFEDNLDRLSAIFPNINIFGYTLLPGTEFFKRREEYRIQTIPVAGYGRAKGEYVVGCHSFDREEGVEGYFLITAHILLVRGCIMPLASRFLALDGTVPVSPLLREVTDALCAAFAAELPQIDASDRMSVYEHRDALYLAALGDLERCFVVVHDALASWLRAHDAPPTLQQRARKVLEVDQALCPRTGRKRTLRFQFDFDAERVAGALSRMELPPTAAFEARASEMHVAHPAHVGEILRDPDGGSWMRGRVVTPPDPPLQTAAS